MGKRLPGLPDCHSDCNREICCLSSYADEAGVAKSAFNSPNDCKLVRFRSSF